MSIAGQIYGVALNDRAEHARLAEAFTQPPYVAAPVAPVVYIKPRSALCCGSVELGSGEELIAAATVALLFARDAARCSPADALDSVGAMCLAVDFSLPQANYYRPAVPQMNRDRFLALGEWIRPGAFDRIDTSIDGGPSHSWTADRLLRDPAALVSDLSQFMTLRAGDALLIGLAGDAPRVRAGQTVEASSPHLPTLRAEITEQAA